MQITALHLYRSTKPFFTIHSMNNTTISYHEYYYQEEGSAKKILDKGVVVKCPPNVPHWHGASADKELIQVAITSRENGPTQWMKPVTHDEYLK